MIEYPHVRKHLVRDSPAGRTYLIDIEDAGFIRITVHKNQASVEFLTQISDREHRFLEIHNPIRLNQCLSEEEK